MTFFNITLIQPRDYSHSQALLEAAQYIEASLRDCGFGAALTTNHLADGDHNIVFCAHMMAENELADLPPGTIIFNSEQLLNRTSWQLAGPYLQALARCYVWDYSLANLPCISHGRKDFIPFAFHPALRRATMPARGDRLLFYGALTDRRLKLIDDIRAEGVPVDVVYGKYGEERDALMFRAFAVLNLHGSDTVGTFEPIRCFYPLTNGIPVISEATTGDPTTELYSEWLFTFPKAAVANGIAARYREPDRFAQDAQKKLESFRANTDVESIGDAARVYLRTMHGAVA